MRYPRQSATVHVERLDEELCLYDWARQQVHALNPTAAFVWQRCDGATSPADLAVAVHRELAVPEADAAGLVALTLRQLADAHLLVRPDEDSGADPRVEPGVLAESEAGLGVTRRALLRRGLAAALLPAIHSLAAPPPAAAQSPGGPNGRFVDQGLTVLDTDTNLIWEKKTGTAGGSPDAGDLHNVNNLHTWCAATGNADGSTPCAGNTDSWIADVNAATFAGASSWRVPTLTELESIVDLLAGPPTIDPIFGPTATDFYWSSIPLSADGAALVSFLDGHSDGANKAAFSHPVRAVRNAS